jgi:DNA-binding response OmpR family regulator
MTSTVQAVRVLCFSGSSRSDLAFVEVQNVELHHRLTKSEMPVADIERLRPEVVLIDFDCVDRSAHDFCRQIRSRHDVPIIIISRSASDIDECVAALDNGVADDYVTVARAKRELVARIRVHVRRYRGELAPAKNTITVGTLVVDLAQKSVMVRGALLDLTVNEYALVSTLAMYPGRVMSREQLLHVVHGSADEAFDRAIDVLISRIRTKFERCSSRRGLLRTVRGIGYMMQADVSAVSDIQSFV